jgi:DNA-binding GntR family transcriptional regulator
MRTNQGVINVTDLTPVQLKTLGNEVANRLRNAIRTGEFPLGTRLVERDLAERLGVSRIPVREAIQQLVEEGLVQKTPHRGTFVHSPTRSEIEEISSLRVALECFVIERVIVNWLPEHETRLRQIVATMRLAAARNDMQGLFEQDYLFHNTLWEIADHSLLLEVVSGLRARINRFLGEATALLPASQLDMHIDSHDDMIDIIKNGDIDKAKAEITNHVLGAKTRILTYLDFPETSHTDSEA